MFTNILPEWSQHLDYNVPKLETAQISINSWVGKQIVVKQNQIKNNELLIYLKIWTNLKRITLSGVENKKPDKRYILYDFHLCKILEK